DALKLTVPQGSLVLPMWKDGDLEKVSGTATVGTGVRITATDFTFDKEKKKLTFTSGKVILADGTEIPITKAHLPTTALPNETALTKGGVLEPLLKSGEALAKVKATDEDKAIIEVVDWVKPEERVTVWWQVLAFLIITIAEILISV